MKFYSGGTSGNKSSATLLDFSQVASENVKSKKRQRKYLYDEMLTKSIPYSENTLPLPCNMSSPENEQGSPEAKPDKPQSPQAKPDKYFGLLPIKQNPVSPLPKSVRAYSYFPNVFPFEISSPRDTQSLDKKVGEGSRYKNDSLGYGSLDLDATEPYTRAAMGFNPALEWHYYQPSTYDPAVLSCADEKGANGERSVDKGNEGVGEKERRRDVLSTSTTNIKAYKMKHPVKCRYCERTFWSHTGRYYHEAIHTGKWLFQCKYCDTGFMQRKAYDSHMRAKHKSRTGSSAYSVSQASWGDGGSGSVNDDVFLNTPDENRMGHT